MGQLERPGCVATRREKLSVCVPQVTPPRARAAAPHLCGRKLFDRALSYIVLIAPLAEGWHVFDHYPIAAAAWRVACLDIPSQDFTGWLEWMNSPVDDPNKGWLSWYSRELEEDREELPFSKKMQAVVRRSR